MIPIQELLSRIRWDEAYGNADFVIGVIVSQPSPLPRLILPKEPLQVSNGVLMTPPSCCLAG